MTDAAETRVRVYQGLRTAHLERFGVLAPARVYYFRESYDFDRDLAATLDVHHLTSRRALFVRLLTSRISALEINEPLTVPGIKSAFVAVLAVRLGGLLRRARTTVVTYAIENVDPFIQEEGPYSRFRRRLYAVAARAILSQVDRLAYGTSSAQEVYRPYVARFHGRAALIEALPAACAACHDEMERAAPSSLVVFVGAFLERKGMPRLLEAWPEVRRQRPDARLWLLGKGRLQHLAEDAADHDDTITVSLDPSRAEIHRALTQAKVLVLLSRPEQVGLPILEGLGHGCEIVCTDETGLARWLRSHSHHVVPARPLLIESVVAGLESALNSERSRSAVLDDLPEIDGRLVADRWMFAQGDGDPFALG